MGGEDRALAKVLDGLRAGKKPREIAVDIYGAEEVRDMWYPDSGMRSQMRRWLDKAERHDRRRLARPGSAPWVRRVTGIREACRGLEGRHLARSAQERESRQRTIRLPPS